MPEQVSAGAVSLVRHALGGHSVASRLHGLDKEARFLTQIASLLCRSPMTSLADHEWDWEDT